MTRLPYPSYSLPDADLATLVERALAGEPQRVTRGASDAVVIVSEAAWTAATARRSETLADLMLRTAGADEQGFADLLNDRTGRGSDGSAPRALGPDFD